jgi:N-acetylglutamate synthase-like GNAT family acetyltransferase
MSVTNKTIHEFQLLLRNASSTSGAVPETYERKVVGFAAVSAVNRVLSIDAFVVAPGAEGKQIEAALIHRLTSNWHSFGYQTIQLRVSATERNTDTFYTDMGFTERSGDVVYGQRSNVSRRTRKLLKARPLAPGVKLKFEFDKQRMRTQHPEHWLAVTNLYGGAYKAPLLEALKPNSMFIVALE